MILTQSRLYRINCVLSPTGLDGSISAVIVLVSLVAGLLDSRSAPLTRVALPLHDLALDDGAAPHDGSAGDAACDMDDDEEEKEVEGGKQEAKGAWIAGADEREDEVTGVTADSLSPSLICCREDDEDGDRARDEVSIDWALDVESATATAAAAAAAAAAEEAIRRRW